MEREISALSQTQKGISTVSCFSLHPQSPLLTPLCLAIYGRSPEDPAQLRRLMKMMIMASWHHNSNMSRQQDRKLQTNLDLVNKTTRPIQSQVSWPYTIRAHILVLLPLRSYYHHDFFIILQDTFCPLTSFKSFMMKLHSNIKRFALTFFLKHELTLQVKFQVLSLTLTVTFTCYCDTSTDFYS